MAFVLRVCKSDGSSYDGFKWPLIVGAIVAAPDWKPTEECGNGLHGWLHGAGDYSTCSHFGEGAKWLVVQVDGELIDLGGKVKFREGIVRFVGDSKSATDFLWEHDPESRVLPVIGAHRADMRDRAVVFVGAFGHATAGYEGTATAGNLGTATAGNRGTATAGDQGTATAGDEGTATAGDQGTATAGYEGTATAGNRGTATAGYEGTATAGNLGTATAGNWGTATAGYEGTATAGDRGAATAGTRGTATAGTRGTATAGDQGTISILYFDGTKYRRKSADVGDGGLKPNTKYRIENGEFVEC